MMTLKFAVMKENGGVSSGTMKKKFAPWETIFDEMFQLWFGIDFPSRDTSTDGVARGAR
jgi:hypothetical protein